MYFTLVRTIAPFLLLFMSEECLESIFIDLDILNFLCLKMILSKALGYAIVGGSMMVKFPQILKISSNASVEGLSLATFALEAFCAMVNVGYNFSHGFPFSTWGENFFILLQLLVLLVQFFHYTGNTMLKLVTPLLVPLLTLALTKLPQEHLALGLTAVVPLMALSKIIQIKTNFVNGHTGQLSFVTSLLNAFGTLARLFTILQEIDDLLILANCTTVFALNAMIVMQFLVYWNVVPPKEKAQ